MRFALIGVLALAFTLEVPIPWNADPGNAGDCLKSNGAGNYPVWGACGSGGGDPLPAGAIIFIISGSCPSGYSEETSLAAKFIVGTTNGAGDVGTGGGNDNITSVLNHTHPVTDPGHNHTQNAHTHVVTSQTATTGSATSYEHGTLDTSSAEAEVTEVTGSTTATNQSNTTGLTTNNPSGGVASIDNRPAFLRLIPCKKT